MPCGLWETLSDLLSHSTPVLKGNMKLVGILALLKCHSAKECRQMISNIILYCRAIPNCIDIAKRSAYKSQMCVCF